MPSLRPIKNRIRSVESTTKITSALQMISALKLSRTSKMLDGARPYALGLEALLNNLTSSREEFRNIFLEKRPRKEKLALCVVTSDSGLCGMYNNNVISYADDFLRQHNDDTIKLIPVGKKGLNHFKQYAGAQIINTYDGLHGRYSQKECEAIAQYLIKIFLSQEVDEVYVAYTHFQNTLVHKPVIKKFLNIERTGGESSDYILEPNIDRVLEELIPKYLCAKMRMILLESFTSEHASRIVAMKAATDNAKELSQQLILLKNKVRQANITQEIMEVVSSSEAVGG
jgi:F-type H+-transporting ATPase subunit gamma